MDLDPVLPHRSYTQTFVEMRTKHFTGDVKLQQFDKIYRMMIANAIGGLDLLDLKGDPSITACTACFKPLTKVGGGFLSSLGVGGGRKRAECPCCRKTLCLECCSSRLAEADARLPRALTVCAECARTCKVLIERKVFASRLREIKEKGQGGVDAYNDMILLRDMALLRLIKAEDMITTTPLHRGTKDALQDANELLQSVDDLLTKIQLALGQTKSFFSVNGDSEAGLKLSNNVKASFVSFLQTSRSRYASLLETLLESSKRDPPPKIVNVQMGTANPGDSSTGEQGLGSRKTGVFQPVVVPASNNSGSANTSSVTTPGLTPTPTGGVTVTVSQEKRDAVVRYLGLFKGKVQDVELCFSPRYGDVWLVTTSGLWSAMRIIFTDPTGKPNASQKIAGKHRTSSEDIKRIRELLFRLIAEGPELKGATFTVNGTSLVYIGDSKLRSFAGDMLSIRDWLLTLKDAGSIAFTPPSNSKV